MTSQSRSTPSQIEVPVHVIWGDRDRLTVPDGAAELAELIPHARIEMLAGVGHTPQVEAPDVVVEAIEGWQALVLVARLVRCHPPQIEH